METSIYSFLAFINGDEVPSHGVNTMQHHRNDGAVNLLCVSDMFEHVGSSNPHGVPVSSASSVLLPVLSLHL